MRVLIATVTAGAGHLQAAAAIEEAWRLLRSADTVERVDVLTFTSKLYRKAYAEGYVRLVERAPELYGLVFRASDNPPLLRKLTNARRFFARLPTKKFIKHAQEFSPDVVICTHFLPPEILGNFRLNAKRNEFHAKIVSVVTDFEAHALWTEPDVTLYCVATEETKARMTARGVAEERILVTGIPISQRFTTHIDGAAVRKRMNLRADLPCVLVLGGGFGMGPVAEILGELNKVAKSIQAVIVCGRNEALRDKLAAMKHRHTTQVLGFVNNMQDLMSVADIIVSKPGGLTSSEALALGKPLLILNPIPGQEAANSDFLLEHGGAAKINRVEDLPSKLDRLLGSAKLGAMSEAARELGRPGAAVEVCQGVVSLVEGESAPATSVRASRASGKSAHSIILYESLGSATRDGKGWEVEVHGRVFSSKPHPKLERLLHRFLGLKLEQMTAEERRLLSERAQYFLEDSGKGKPVTVHAGANRVLLTRSRANGHFEGRFSVAQASLARVVDGGERLELRVSGERSESPSYTGQAQLLGATGVSVISDIDDTIKVSHGGDRRAMIHNTFCQPFAAVAGMAPVYQSWARATGASFHYVSASPWQLYPALRDFLQCNGFPQGTFHLRRVRLKDQSILSLLAFPAGHKQVFIARMLRRYPRRQFILVGDTIGRDPEIYGDLARRFPQVARIYLHQPREAAVSELRLGKALRKIPPEKWQMFRDPTELPTTPLAQGRRRE
jgi:processive 1,2-diacylglycerol beta-glucosyltransferase